jgi:hypothetical protein
MSIIFESDEDTVILSGPPPVPWDPEKTRTFIKANRNVRRSHLAASVECGTHRWIAASAPRIALRSAAAAAIGHSSPLRILFLRAETSFLFRIG